MPPTEAQARALVVGVPETAYRGNLFPRLRGVGRDVAAVSSMLAARGFRVSTPSGAALSAGAVANALVEVVDATRSGDLTVIYLTGHGFQVPDTSMDEPDGDRWDEAFVCADRPILDDWFHDQLWPRARPGSQIVTIVDACHSDSIMRYIEAPPPAPPIPITIVPDGPYRLTLSACRDEETTLDLGPGDDGGGVVTKAMLARLRLATSPYRALWCRVAEDVHPDPRRGIGVPQYSYLGPSDDLLDAAAFQPVA